MSNSGVSPTGRGPKGFLRRRSWVFARDRVLGFADIDLRLSENRDSIDFRARRGPEQLGRYLKQYDRAYSRMLRTIRAAGFSRVGFEELGLEVDGDQLEGGFLVRPLEEVCQQTDQDDIDDNPFEI